MTAFQLDPSTHAPCTSSTLAFGWLPPPCADAACAVAARPDVVTIAAPASAAVPFKTFRRVDMLVVPLDAFGCVPRPRVENRCPSRTGEGPGPATGARSDWVRRVLADVRFIG